MIAVRVHLEDNSSYVTSVNGSVTDREIEDYFINKLFTQADETTLLLCTKIEIDRS
jgi:hypothetical protein